MDSEGPASPAVLFTTDPKFTGAFQGHSPQSRCDTQRSVAPRPPGRSELK